MEKVKEREGEITFETGSMAREELEAMLNTLPLEITFVDKEDTVCYFNEPRGEGSSHEQRQSSVARCNNAILREAYIW